MIYVRNKRKFALSNGGGHYIGRPSALGNPFVLNVDGNRETVIAKYRTWLYEQIEHNNHLVLDEILALLKSYYKNGEHLDLICYCAPLACHGDVLSELLQEMIVSEQFTFLK